MRITGTKTRTWKKAYRMLQKMERGMLYRRGSARPDHILIKKGRTYYDGADNVVSEVPVTLMAANDIAVCVLPRELSPEETALENQEEERDNNDD